MKKQITYKTIFQSDTKESLSFTCIGEYNYTNKHTITFTHDDTYTIAYDNDSVILKHGLSTLYFSKNKDIDNDYYTPYGNIPLTTKLLKYSGNNQHLKMIYELYQGTDMIHKVYLYITLKDVGEPYEVS